MGYNSPAAGEEPQAPALSLSGEMGASGGAPGAPQQNGGGESQGPRAQRSEQMAPDSQPKGSL